MLSLTINCYYLQARTHQLLLQNRELLCHINALVGRLKQLEAYLPAECVEALSPSTNNSSNLNLVIF